MKLLKEYRMPLKYFHKSAEFPVSSAAGMNAELGEGGRGNGSFPVTESSERVCERAFKPSGSQNKSARLIPRRVFEGKACLGDRTSRVY